MKINEELVEMYVDISRAFITMTSVCNSTIGHSSANQQPCFNIHVIILCLTFQNILVARANMTDSPLDQPATSFALMTQLIF